MAATQTPPSSAQRFNVGETVTPAKPTREAVLATIVKLLVVKGAQAVAQIEQKVKMGQGLTVKGTEVGTDMLREALAQVAKGPKSVPAPSPAGGNGISAVPRPLFATAGSTAPPAAAAGGMRFAVNAPSAGALAQKALQECETAEPFVRRVKNVGDNKVAILTKPNVFAHATGEHIAPGEVFDVIARCIRMQDGRTYLRLRKAEGWVSTRSRRDLFKIVLASAEGGSVEPLGCPSTFQSRAAQVLSRVDAEGRRVDSEGQPTPAAAASMKEARSFRIAGGRGQSILSHPSSTGAVSAAVGGTLQAREEFLADAVCIASAEGRAYLRMQDGRGWVCERSKGSYMSYAVEPAGFRVHTDDYERPAAPKRMMGGHAKTFVIDRSASMAGIDNNASAAPVAPPKPTPRCAALKDEAVVLRSDSELWPKALGAPRPIKGAMRVALRRLSRQYFCRVKECEEDLKEVESRIESFARACDGKKILQSHADVLRKEITKIEQEWKVAIEKDVADVVSAPAAKAARKGGDGTVAPVQVLGEAWHCAVVRAEQDDGEGGKTMLQHFGPLRSEPAAAGEDLKQLAEAVSKWVPSIDSEVSPDGKKKRRTSKDGKDAKGSKDADSPNDGKVAKEHNDAD